MQNADLEKLAREKPVIRDATSPDLEHVHAIYAHHVGNGLASFEEIPPTIDELAARRTSVLALGLPYVVAQVQGEVVGFAYASSYRSRSAYRHTVEDSVYVKNGWDRRSIGTALLSAVVSRCEAGPWRQMIAVIGNSENAGSIALHARHGFRHAGLLTAVGFKFGRWVDSVLMQRPLGAGQGTLPER